MNDEFKPITEILKNMPAAPKPDFLLPYKSARIVHPGQVVPCQLCGKSLEVLQNRFFNTDQVTGAYDVACDECRKQLEGTVAIVCMKCRQVAFRAKPSKLSSGFILEAGKFYHTEQCPVCNPEIAQSSLLEAKAWESAHKSG